MAFMPPVFDHFQYATVSDQISGGVEGLGTRLGLSVLWRDGWVYIHFIKLFTLQLQTCIVYVTCTVLDVTVRYTCDITLSAAPMTSVYL